MSIPTSETSSFCSLDMLLCDHEEKTKVLLEVMDITLQSFECLSKSILESNRAITSLQERIAKKRKNDLVYIPLILFSAAVTGAFLGLRRT